MFKRKRPTNVRTVSNQSPSLENLTDINPDESAEILRTKAIIEHKKLVSESRTKKKLLGGDTLEVQSQNTDVKNTSIIEETSNIPKKDYSNLESNFVQGSLKTKEEIMMMKYVEERLRENENTTINESRYFYNYILIIISRDQPKTNRFLELLNNVPDYLKNAKRAKVNQDMLSNQMLTGIPEVELSVTSKMNNVEAIELANLKKNSFTPPKLNTTNSMFSHPYLAKRFLSNSP